MKQVDKKRVGFLIPAINNIFPQDAKCLNGFIEAVYGCMATGPRITGESSLERARRMNELVPHVISDMGAESLDGIVYACATGSFLSSSVNLKEDLERWTGKPATTTSTAMLRMTEEYKGRRVSILTPYSQSVNKRMAEVFEAAGMKVIQVETDPIHILPGNSIGDETPSQIAQFVEQKLSDRAEVLIMPCTGWRAMEARDLIRKAFSLPIITANQAILWEVMRKLGFAHTAEASLAAAQ